jgi:serine/threonine protein kinase
MPNKAQDDDLVMSLVDLALTHPVEQREAYLRSACGDDTELFNQTWSYVQWEGRMNGFLLDPLYPAVSYEHPFEPGELLDDRFRIVREIAQGGMGIVYEAVDEKLQRRIALKCAKTGFRKRLPPEVRNATEISHPNVCKIFEIHTASTRQGEIDFITMEFLDGETLADRLTRAPLSEKEARVIALQLCAGLAEAHHNRVIHGDLKNNNVILTTGQHGSVRAVITDFGLARGPEVAQATAPSGQMAGTPDYMAPELWKGGKASVASDIYALGVILSQLGSGRPQKRILARCLHEDPASRFPNADDIAQALVPLRSRRWFLATAAAAILAVVTGVVTYQRATAPQESVRLAMLPFESDPQTASVARDLLKNTSDQLARLKGSAHTKLTLIPRDKIAADHVDTTEKAKSLFGATHVLRGTLHQENDKVILDAYLTDARSLVNRKQWRAQYGPGQMRYAPVALAGIVTGTLRLPPLAFAVTVNAAAKQDYWNGLYYLRQNSTLDLALSLLQRSALADPGSALTIAGLAEAQWFEYFFTKDEKWLVGSRESVRQAERINSDLAPVHRVEGYLDYAAGFYEQSVAELERAMELQPENAMAYIWLGKAHEDNNQPDEALAAYQKATQVDPNYYRTYQNLASFYNNRSDYSRAAQYLQQAVKLAPNEPDTHFALGVVYMNSGNYSKAESELRLAIGLRETTTALHTLGVALMCQGRDQEAIPYISRALSLGPERHLWWLNLGIAYRRVNRMAESLEANRRGLELAEADLRNNPRSGYVRSHLAYLCARLGEKGRAMSEIGQALGLSPNEADVRWMAAITYEAVGRRQDTLAVLSASPPAVIGDVSRWPDVADLHDDPQFLQLLASRQIR